MANSQAPAFTLFTLSMYKMHGTYPMISENDTTRLVINILNPILSMIREGPKYDPTMIKHKRQETIVVLLREGYFSKSQYDTFYFFLC
jgi:hypothetical protein